MTTKQNIPFSEARIQLTNIMNEVAYRGKRIIITRKGKQIVAIVPLEDLAVIEALENKNDLDAVKNYGRKSPLKRFTII